MRHLFSCDCEVSTGNGLSLLADVSLSENDASVTGDTAAALRHPFSSDSEVSTGNVLRLLADAGLSADDKSVISDPVACVILFPQTSKYSRAMQSTCRRASQCE